MARATACIALLLPGATALGQAGCAADACRLDAPRPADTPPLSAVPTLDLALLHVNLRGLRPKDRARDAGLRCNPGENLCQTYQYASYQTVYDGTRVEAHYDWKTERQLAEDAVAAWLESPAHRAALLSPAFIAHGVGALRAPGLKAYLTQNLC